MKESKKINYIGQLQQWEQTVEEQKQENEKCEDKQLHGHLKRQTREIAHEMRWIW